MQTPRNLLRALQASRPRETLQHPQCVFSKIHDWEVGRTALKKITLRGLGMDSICPIALMSALCKTQCSKARFAWCRRTANFCLCPPGYRQSRQQCGTQFPFALDGCVCYISFRGHVTSSPVDASSPRVVGSPRPMLSLEVFLKGPLDQDILASSLSLRALRDRLQA